ncbi:hypothetical protein AB7828_24890 [Tardiphaga sp. 215_C5_N2_1]|uniref:hypothetical protein n=1 Tax=Tardiphaga sp. 215_C5_N2_1 TaxID=3240774 RepID=UPI003F886290
MKGDRIPKTDNLALHCQPTSMEIDETGVVTGVSVEAFRVDDDGISTNWLEFDGGNLEAVCGLFKSLRTVRKSHRVGLIAVNDVEEVGVAHNKDVHAIHDPIDTEPLNPGHALIVGVGPLDQRILRALSLMVEVRTFA